VTEENRNDKEDNERIRKKGKAAKGHEKAKSPEYPRANKKSAAGRFFPAACYAQL
jgi:hypothetical protein